MSRTWTQADNDQLLALLEETSNNRTIARVMHRTTAAIYARRRDMGLVGGQYGANRPYHDAPPTSSSDEVTLAPETSPGTPTTPDRAVRSWTTVWSRTFFWGHLTITKYRRNP